MKMSQKSFHLFDRGFVFLSFVVRKLAKNIVWLLHSGYEQELKQKCSYNERFRLILANFVLFWVEILPSISLVVCFLPTQKNLITKMLRALLDVSRALSTTLRARRSESFPILCPVTWGSHRSMASKMLDFHFLVFTRRILAQNHNLVRKSGETL